MEVNQCTIYGYLYGSLCDDLRVWDYIEGAQIIAVPSDQDDGVFDGLGRLGRGTGNRAARDIDAEKFKQVTTQDAFRATTGKNGVFCFDEQGYNGGPLDIYVCIDRVPAPTLEEGSVKLDTPCYLFLGTYQPYKVGDVWYLILVIPAVTWCRVRRKADLWVIVGHVAPCADRSIGLGAVTVTARDADIVQHDVLGSATTNASGIFRIDYPGVNFRQGTWLDVELFGGPDVYFEVRDADNNVLIDETPADGRRAGRKNRGPCFCIHLCAPVDIPPRGLVPGAWTGVGDTFTIPDASSTNDFEPEGYGDLPGSAGTERYGFTGILRLTGSSPRFTAAGHPVEYRFLVSNSTTPNGGAPPPLGTFTRKVGVGADANLFPTSGPSKLRKIGNMIRFAPHKLIPVYAELGDLDADGWLDVNTSITRTFLARPDVTPADIPDFAWVDLDVLMPLDTNALTSQPDVPNVGQAGVPVPPPNQIMIEKNAIRFEIREVVDKPNSVFNTMPGSGTTLNSIIVNNNPAYLKVAMAEHLATTPCTIISGTPHVAYTAYHPHLLSVGINVHSNDHPAAGSYNVNINDGTIPVTSNHNPAVTQANRASSALPASDAQGDPLKPCSYLVTLSVRRRLHNGDNAVSSNTDQTTFCYV